LVCAELVPAVTVTAGFGLVHELSERANTPVIDKQTNLRFSDTSHRLSRNNPTLDLWVMDRP
jgi:hypothetical protein